MTGGGTRLARSALLLLAAACGGDGATEHADARPDASVDASLFDAPPNQRPVAVAGEDVIVGPGALVSLDGANSYDPDGGPVHHAWLLAGAPASSGAALSDPTSITPTLAADVPGVYLVSLVVDDGELASAPDVIAITAVEGVPFANAGADQTVPHGSVVALDGTASLDLDGDALTYAWAFVERPPGSTAALDDATAATPTFVADVVGSYVLELGVHDGTNASPADRVAITATNAAPVASAGVDRVAAIGDNVELVGTATDPDGDPLTISWALTARPAGSAAALAPTDALTTHLMIDVPGAYHLTLTASDGELTTSNEVIVGTPPDVTVLDHDTIDAEYSRALDKIVLVASDPAELAVVDGALGAETTVALPLPPTSVSVSPDGLEAVVGHDGWITVVDLATVELTASWPTSAVVGDVVHGGNGYAYVIPEIDQAELVRSVALATGSEALGTGLITAGGRAKRHPSQTAFYLATRSSPGDLERHSIAGAASAFVDDSPYHGEYPMCGNLWLSEDGARIFTECGHVFRASASPSLDMLHVGSLSDTARARHLDDSTAAQRVAAIPSNVDTRVDVYESAFLGLVESLVLPLAFIDGAWLQPHGRFVFFSQDGVEVYVVMTAGPPSAAQTLIWRPD